MPLFEYSGLNPSGKTVSGRLDAEDQPSARSILKERGVYLTAPLKESKTSAPFGLKSIQAVLPLFLGERGPSLAEISAFTYQIKTLLGSGLPMVEALTILVNEEKNGRFQKVLADVRDRVRDGEALAPALSRHPAVFSDLYVNVVSAGDAAGMLEEAFGHLAEYLERQERITSRVRAAMIYPSFMAVTGTLILYYLLISVVPKVVSVFHGAGKALPLPTRILIGVSGFLSSYWILTLIAASAAMFATYRVTDRKQRKEFMESLFDRTPFLKDMLHAMYMARFGRIMEALLRGGVPLAKAVGISSSALGHSAIEGLLAKTEKEILDGRSFSSSLKESGYFPGSVVSLISVGEAGGNLEEVMGRIGAAKEKELDGKLDALLALAEPVMILVMGVIVGFIVLAILLPIFEMSQISF